MKVRLKMWHLERTQGFLKIWPSDLVFNPTWPIFELKILSRQTFWPSFMIIGLKMWPLECTQGFSKIWLGDLVFDLTWSILKLVRDFIKTNILTKFHDNRTENVASRAYTSKRWPRTTHDGRRTTNDGHSTITIVNSEHFVLRWAKKSLNFLKKILRLQIKMPQELFMRTRKRYPDNPRVMHGEYRNALRLGYRGCHFRSNY